MNRKPLQLPRDEMAFRKAYQHLLEAETLTTVFRPERRLCHNERGYCPGEIVYARVIERPGNDEALIPPRFTNLQKPIRIETVRALAIGEMKADDFIGSSPDVQNTEDLRFHLGLIYNLPYDKFSNDHIITRITFSYEGT